MEVLPHEQAVKARYGAAAQTSEPALCCAVQYSAELLRAIPVEVTERDYGCGNPAEHLRRGETVLDLGSGTGKICFIAAQIVGPEGLVIGVDMTGEMLEVARRNAPMVAANLGYANVEFRRGRIQDLALNLDLFDAELSQNPVRSAEDFFKAEAGAWRLRREQPLIPAGTVDVVVSNCVLNLVDSTQKAALFGEIFRVLKPGGRAVISDIISGAEVPVALQNDPELWSGCISGALTEGAFLGAFGSAGFQDVEIIKRDAEPWRMVEGIDFRSVTVRAFKPEARAADRKVFSAPRVFDFSQNAPPRSGRCC